MAIRLPHAFTPYPLGHARNANGDGKSCLKCGRLKDHPIHTIPKGKDEETSG